MSQDKHVIHSGGSQQLVDHGPILQLRFGGPTPQAPVPQIPGALLIDTGATMSMVTEDMIAQLNIAPISTTSIIGVGGTPIERPVYELGLYIGMDGASGNHELVFSGFFASMQALSSAVPVHGLLGRNVLQHFRLIYDGASGLCELVRGAPAMSPRKIRANELCPCKSGKKYKRCHGRR